jgi:uncharacterized protein
MSTPMSPKTFEIRTIDGTVGKGLFSTRDIKPETCLLEYLGERISNEEADIRSENEYLFEVNDKVTIDGSGIDNLARYVNHSCDPNIQAEIEGDRIFYFSAHPIAKGEELTIDYGQEHWDEHIKPNGCRCAHCHDHPKTKYGEGLEEVEE